MGTQKTFNPEGGFSEYLYEPVGDEIIASNGVKAIVVQKINGTPYEGLPKYSNTKEMYLKANEKGEVVQARLYKDRKPVCDFDFDHAHTNKNGEKFDAGVVHVQEWKPNAKGELTRDYKHARYMTNSEIARFGELFRMVNPDVKFVP